MAGGSPSFSKVGILVFTRRINETVLQSHVEVGLYILRMQYIDHLLTLTPNHVTQFGKWSGCLKKTCIRYLKPVNIKSMEAWIKTWF